MKAIILPTSDNIDKLMLDSVSERNFYCGSNLELKRKMFIELDKIDDDLNMLENDLRLLKNELELLEYEYCSEK